MQAINHAKHTIKILNILKYTARYAVGKNVKHENIQNAKLCKHARVLL